MIFGQENVWTNHIRSKRALALMVKPDHRRLFYLMLGRCKMARQWENPRPGSSSRKISTTAVRGL
jgi:hypothetical protein